MKLFSKFYYGDYDAIPSVNDVERYVRWAVDD